MITVFYDGKCGLCSREIAHYKKIAPDGIFNWQDITDDPTQLNDLGITVAQGLKYLYATDHDGKIHIGTDAFILMWSNIKRWRILAKFVSLPIIYPITKWVYKQFAHWRFKKIRYCNVNP